MASNFERMVRISVGTGIPLDPPVLALTHGLRRRLGVDRFGAAANTPLPGPTGRARAAALRPLADTGLRLAAGLRRARLRLSGAPRAR